MNPAAPFAPNAGRESFFEAEGLREALERLSEARGDREPFLLVTGEPGCGKTLLVREAIARWGDSACAAWLSCPAHSDAELVEEIVRRFGAEPPEGASVPRLVACFEQALGAIADRGQLAVIVVDDAHSLEVGMLEELRLLVNAAQRAGRALEVMLVGLPALQERLEEPALSALRQRISVRCEVRTLPPAETARYLHHRVSVTGGDGPGMFGRKSCREIATQSRGLPREINALATEALRRARAAGQPTVGIDHVRAAATSLWGRELPAVAAEPAGDGAGAPRAAEPPSGTASVTIAAPAMESSDPASVPPSVTPPDPALRAPVAPQDPREWVQRFIGDRGPIQIGSQAPGPASWGREAPEARPVRAAPPEARPARAAAATARPTKPSRPEPMESPEPPATSAEASPAERPRRGERPGILVPALVAIAVVGLVVILVRAGDGVRSGRATTRHAATQPDTATVSASVQEASAARLARLAVTSGTAVAEPVSAPAADDAAPDTVAMTASSRLTLDVGSYISPDRAGSERDRLRAKTGLGAWVVRQAEGGNETFHVLLGIYRTNARASAAADLLLIEGRVSQVKVVRLPPKHLRR